MGLTVEGEANKAFLSTLSLRRATGRAGRPPARLPDFYPRSPCGERLGGRCCCKTKRGISIHALLAESDGMWATAMPCGMRFLSTLSLRRATQQQQQRAGVHGISIHALLAESDASSLAQQKRNRISIHALLAESDDQRHCHERGQLGISIHALLAESDHFAKLEQVRKSISIHALLAESDGRQTAECVPGGYFYPRSPCGERLRARAAEGRRPEISIHALLAESDRKKENSYIDYCISIHALLAESDLTVPDLCEGNIRISIHALLAESDAQQRKHAFERLVFLSTLSLRRATNLCICDNTYTLDFYPRSPCGERPPFSRSGPMMRPYFYPRSPCGERR